MCDNVASIIIPTRAYLALFRCNTREGYRQRTNSFPERSRTDTKRRKTPARAWTAYPPLVSIPSIGRMHGTEPQNNASPPPFRNFRGHCGNQTVREAIICRSKITFRRTMDAGRHAIYHVLDPKNVVSCMQCYAKSTILHAPLPAAQWLSGIDDIGWKIQYGNFLILMCCQQGPSFACAMQCYPDRLVVILQEKA
jgi:hypothetical protein